MNRYSQQLLIAPKPERAPSMIVPTTISRDRQAVIKSMSGFESSGDGSGMNDSKNRHIKGGTKDSKGREMIIYEKRRGTARRMIRRSRRRQMRKCRTRILPREREIGKHQGGDELTRE